jgi:hypothetical protein
MAALSNGKIAYQGRSPRGSANHAKTQVTLLETVLPRGARRNRVSDEFLRPETFGIAEDEVSEVRPQTQELGLVAQSTPAHNWFMARVLRTVIAPCHGLSEAAKARPRSFTPNQR